MSGFRLQCKGRVVSPRRPCSARGRRLAALVRHRTNTRGQRVQPNGLPCDSKRLQAIPSDSKRF